MLKMIRYVEILKLLRKVPTDQQMDRPTDQGLESRARDIKNACKRQKKKQYSLKRQMDLQTDQSTDRPTDIVAYGVACMQLKIKRWDEFMHLIIREDKNGGLCLPTILES